ncbi:T6SS immunity protein Tli4 family protein [Pelotalea chapellei]|uniref:Tle cognate immunity protein 4 C-terminal domain-containing protein n=1 Tax=Pelotalea chapellei TaxID=44671 RepID=A0ABS5UAR4_9BACT|nr:T6SS immunity protein Tli4 family protein [Pelotalea chapellei]MBT1072762.1 hypothetical protein [Pelotalea chapellei]
MGRFAIDVPAEFKLAVQSQRFRLTEIVEYPNVKDAEQEWRNHLAKIEKTKKPKGVNKIIIKELPINKMGKWAKGVLYYSDSMADDECNWDIFVSYGNSAALFPLKGLLDKQQSMFTWVQEIANAYIPNLNQRSIKGNQFHTTHGSIDLLYKRQEETYARFEGHPFGLKLEIQMEETHKVEETGVMDRLTASLATNFAPGVDVDKIRTGKRTVAGLSGQEIVISMSGKNDPELFFAWDYQGKENSGEHPEIKIGLECSDGNLEEKLKIWDKTLDSFRPVTK